MIHQTCKNLHQRLVLECDGEVVNLPKLQGIVVLNIASYMGGTNFVRMQRMSAYMCCVAAPPNRVPPRNRERVCARSRARVHRQHL